jgi:hypothetical protein
MDCRRHTTKAANVTSEDGKFVATRIATLFAFVVVVHILGAVLYLLFLDLLSRRWAFALEPPSLIRLHSSLLVLTIPTVVLIYVLEKKKRKLLSGSVFRLVFVGLGILYFVVALLTVLIPAPLLRPT